MSYLKLAVVIVAAAAGAFACSGGDVRKRKSFVVAESKSYEASLYRQNCAVCHGMEANGKQMSGQLIPSLRHGAIENRSEEEIYLQIRDGKMPMPSFQNQLTDQEIRQMARFIRRDLQGKDEAGK